MSIVEVAGVVLSIMGAGFFLAGTVGILRYPDLHTRLHAVTKADNVGLGLLVAGLALLSGSIVVAIKLVLIWLLVLIASATSCCLVASTVPSSTSGQQGADGYVD